MERQDFSELNKQQRILYFNNIFNSLQKEHCENCEKDICGQVKIVNQEQKKICVNCFFTEDEQLIEEFQEFRIYQKQNYKIFKGESNWSAIEELFLLEGMLKCGFGNWNDLKDIINNNQQTKVKKSIQDVVSHYENTYLNKVLQKYQECIESIDGIDQNKTYHQQHLYFKSIDDFLDQKGQSQDDQNSNPEQGLADKYGVLQSKNFGHVQNNQQNQNGTNQKVNQIHETLGYMPKRGDFEHEYDNDAELILAEMEFNEDDNEEIIEMKHKILEIYNARLDQRIRRKKMVIEHGLLDFQSIIRKEKQLNKDEREIYNLMKPFARFNSKEKHEQLCQSLIEEKKLLKRIQDLQFYKDKGYTNIGELQMHLKSEQELKEKNGLEFNSKTKMTATFLQKNEITQQNNQSKRNTRTNKENQEGAKEKVQYISPEFQEDEYQLTEQLQISYADYMSIKGLAKECHQRNFFVNSTIIQQEYKFQYCQQKLNKILEFLENKGIIHIRKNNSQKE